MPHNGPDTVRPGASMSEEQYRELVRSTIPPALPPTIPPPPPMPRIPDDSGRQTKIVLDACLHLIERAFKGRPEELRVVRNTGSLTVIFQSSQKCPLGRIIVSKRFGKELYNVWVQHPQSGTASCLDIARRLDTALLLDSLLPKLKKLTEG